MPRKKLIIIHPDTKEKLTVEEAAKLVGITPGAMRRRLSDPKWDLRKALTQKSDWNRAKNAKSRPKPDFITTVKVPENLILGRSPNSVVKERLAKAEKLVLPQTSEQPTKQVRIALTEEERDKIHLLILSSKLGSLTDAVIALLADNNTTS